MRGYWNDPARTAEAFDEEGFLITGDAVRLVDPDDPAAGLRFDGRISEDFKLSSGTWVRATLLRVELMSRLAPLAADLVVTGADRDEVGLLIFLDPARLAAVPAARIAGGLVADPGLLAEIAALLAGQGHGAAGRVARLAVSGRAALGGGRRDHRQGKPQPAAGAGKSGGAGGAAL